MAVFVGLSAGSARAAAATDVGPGDVARLVGLGRAAAASNQLAAAADFFAQARRADPHSLSALRGACTVALALEQRGSKTVSSREPCHAAVRLSNLPEDERNEVASMMAPRATPSLDDLAVGALLIDAAQRQAVDQPFASLARCDIARRLGSADTMTSCLEDLRRRAPGHPATKLAFAQNGGQASVPLWIVRGLLLILFLGTPIHALRRARRAHNGRARTTLPSPASALVVTCLLGTLVGIRIAAAEPASPPHAVPKEQLSHFQINDLDPESSVPSEEERNAQPLEFGYFLQDLASKASNAGKSGNHAAEALYDRALTKAAPDSAFGPRELCKAEEAGDDLHAAVVACRTVLTRSGSNSADYIRFVGLVLRTPGPLSTDERRELEAVISHLSHGAQLGAVPTMLRCDVALRFNDYPALEACTAELARKAPDDPKTVSFQWALAIEKGDRSAAEGLMDRARARGVSADNVARMQHATRVMTLRHLGRMAGAAGIGALVVTLLLLGVRRVTARRRAVA
ncbi:MAG TPA: hypothetical protein VKZ18_03835 [Polyangia bacterium]|nr:hypothetical protein [Polyangia bacterium]